MAIPVTISPAGAGTVTQATVFTWNGPGDDTDHSFQVGDRTVTITLGDSSYIYDYTLASLTASPNVGYRFVRWEVRSKIDLTLYDGEWHEVYDEDEVIKDNPACELPNSLCWLTDFSQNTTLNMDGTVNGAMKFWTVNVVAVFEKVYTVTAVASPFNGGTVQVESEAMGPISTLANITAGRIITVKARPAAGFVFSHWSDGGAAAHNITVNSDLNLDAFFTRQPTHLLVNSSTMESPAHLVYDPATNLLVADY